MAPAQNGLHEDGVRYCAPSLVARADSLALLRSVGRIRWIGTEMPSKAEHVARYIGAHPGAALSISALTTIACSMMALVIGEFEVSADNAGWESRTTTMANRQVQFRALQECYFLGEDCWNPRRQPHTSTVYPGLQHGVGSYRRRVAEASLQAVHRLKRRLSSADSASELSSPPPPGCRNAAANWNDPTIVYRAKDASTNLLSPVAFQQVCELEGNVLAARGYNAACRAGEGSGCALVNDGACLAPLSATSHLRSATPGGPPQPWP